MGEEGMKFLTKIIIPAFIVSIISIAVEIKQGTARFWNSFLSIIISVGGAFLFSDWILYAVPQQYVILVVSTVAILTDKLISWVLFEFKVDEFMSKLTEILINRLKKK